ncbi:MAG: transcription antiterminator [Bacilli bacterium]|nr:transcription antiterminator [Bacilli bacterium]
MNQDNSLKIERVIGNNVVLTKDQHSGEELVLLGKGIGFALKDGGSIDVKDPRIEKRFRLDDRNQLRQYQSLLEEIEPEIINISEKIITLMESEFKKEVQNKVYLALPSHIQFAIYRIRNDMDIVNPFLYETKMCYPKEYEIAEKAAEMINLAFGIQIPEDEIGFLTFHVYSAVTNVSVGQLVKFTNLTNEMIEIIEQRKSIQIPKEGANYVRLITHLRFSIERINQKTVVKNPFVDEMKKNFQAEYKLALELSSIMKEHLQSEVPEDEIGFLVMHLYRLFQVYGN